MSLQIQNLASGYGKMEILHNVSLKANQGEALAVIGPNGAGKTTLLKTIFGLIRMSRGKILFDGKEITGFNTQNLLRIGLSYVPQGRIIAPEMTTEENLEMGGYIVDDREEVKRRMKHIYEIFPILESRAKQRAGYLSGGEQQMLAIGRALMLNPRLIMVDEPSLGLGPRIVEQVYEKLLEMVKAGTTLILVEQNAYKALKTCQRAYIVEAGRVKYEGPSKDLLANQEVVDYYLRGSYGAKSAVTGKGK